MKKLPFALLLLTFFASGAAALIDQLVWQRYLFTGLGVDLDSMTLIVSTFMLGIGLGAAVGGELADRYPRDRVKMYAAAELVLGLIGLFSPLLFSRFHLLSEIGYSYPVVSILAMLCLLVPTAIMGITLPLLTMEFDEMLSNVGVSVGTLYFFNTLGASFGAWAVVNILFIDFGLGASSRLAGVTNLMCCVCAFGALFLLSKNGVAKLPNFWSDR
jgi:predicted membrane-bound spermidine synthase